MLTTTLRPRETAAIFGLVALLVVWWIWGEVDPTPVVADEQSYVLQSRIFATGRWTAPSPPIPEFFEQSVVQTVPAVASKFPPGHALLMTLGAIFGAPALIPLLLTAIAGALVFLLARRITNQWVGALTALIWLSDPINLRFRAGYFSELTTQVIWLAAFWAMLEWRERRERRWLLALAAVIGWGAFTRPLTMLAFAIPVGLVVVRDIARLERWKDFGLAFALGTAMLGVIPLWSARTTGDWRETPLTKYTRDYLPYDKPGFGVDRTPPRRPLNAVNRATYGEFYREHAVHTPANLPLIAADRLRMIALGEWSGPRMILAPFVVAGLFMMTAPVVFALVCSLALFAAYLTYGHFSEWTLYYFEALPVLSLLAAIGIWRAAGAIYARWRPEGGGPGLGTATAIAVPLVLLIAYQADRARLTHLAFSEKHRLFRARLAQPPDIPAVIFVHYTPGLRPPPHVVQNSPNLEQERTWIVNDLGPRNRELMRIAGPRVPIAFYEEDFRFEIDRSLIAPPKVSPPARDTSATSR